MTFLQKKLYITDLKKACLTRLNIMKKLSHSSCGAGSTTLLRIYRSTIRVKCDYEVAAYFFATKTLLTSLSIVHRLALRLAWRAFHTTPSFNLYMLCNKVPLDSHRQLVFLRSIVQIRKLDQTLVSACKSKHSSPLYAPQPYLLSPSCSRTAPTRWWYQQTSHTDLRFCSNHFILETTLVQPTSLQATSLDSTCTRYQFFEDV